MCADSEDCSAPEQVLGSLKEYERGAQYVVRALEKEYGDPAGPFIRKLLFFRIHIHCNAADAILNLR